MKKKKIALFVLLIVGVLSLVFIYNKKININKNKLVNKSYAIYVKESNSSSYINSKSIPKGSYLLNKEKSFCENNGTISSYDNVNGIVGFSFIGSDRCTLYFDEDSVSPTIGDDLKVENEFLTVTLNDNVMLKSYGLSSSSDTEPEEWFNIPTTPYTLSTSITSNIPYLWVKDVAGNTKVSSKIRFMPVAMSLILKNNGGKAVIEAKGTPTFTNIATSNEGMYATEDDYTATTGMKSYYFRGAVDNNWVKFGKDSSNKDIYWRIIRVNGDGSIRMIYSGTTAPTESTKVVMTGTGTQISTSAFNSRYNSSEYVGYKYEIGKQHGLTNNSRIKTILENWYKTTTLYTDEATSKLVVDSPFCYDRTASASTTGTYGEISGWRSTGAPYYYGSYGRIIENNASWNPSLKCDNELDKYSVSNGTLSYPVGLITADEINMAGGYTNTSNSSYYLYTGQDYWSGSPYYCNGTNSYVFSVDYSGYLAHYLVNYSNGNPGVRSTISLSSDVKLSGDGTWNNPYIVAN